MKRVTWVISSALAAAALSACASTTGGQAASPYECAPGVFEAQVADAAVDRAAGTERLTRYCVADGAFELLEYRMLTPEGVVAMRGATFAIWDEAGGEGHALWAMVGVPGATLLDLSFADGAISAEGIGREGDNAFYERSTTSISATEERYVMERSADAGESWEPYIDVTYALTAEEPDWLAEEWTPELVDYAPELVGEGGFLVLDGYGWADLLTADDGEIEGVQFATIVREGENWLWRTLTWRAGEGEAMAEHETWPGPVGPHPEDATPPEPAQDR